MDAYWLAAVVVLGSLVAAAGAIAKGHYKFQGKPSGVFFKKGTAPIPPGRPATSFGPALLAPLAPVSCPQPQPNSACNMTYDNGPVQHTDTAHIIYWLPTGFSFQSNYQSVIQSYVTDVAADSGRVSNPYATDTQYSDTTNGNILYSSTDAGTSTDRMPFRRGTAAARCRAPRPSVTQTQETSELDAFIKANSLPRSINDIYFLVLPGRGADLFRRLLRLRPVRRYHRPCHGQVQREYVPYHSSFNRAMPDDLGEHADGADGSCNVVPIRRTTARPTR